MEEKGVNRSILRLAWPAILEMTLHTFVWVVDTAMVGRLGKEAIAAVSLGAQIMFGLTFIIGAAASVGVTSRVARFTGAGEPERAAHATRQGLFMAVAMSLAVTTAILGLAGGLMRMITRDVQVAELAGTYLRLVFIGGFFQFPYFVVNGALRGAGNTKVPLVSALFADGFNVLGDYVLIFGKFGFPALGVRGAALATGLALALGFSISFFYLIKGGAGFKVATDGWRRIDGGEMRRLARVGMPALFENLMNEGSRLLSSVWIVQLGTLSYAAHSITVAAESLSFMPGYGFSVAATTLAGQYLGAGDPRGAEASTGRAAGFAMGFMSFVGVVFLMIPRVIMGFFTKDAAVVALAARCLMIAALEQPFIAASMTLSGALRGAGDTRGPFYVSMISNLGIRLPLIYAVVFLYEAEVTYVWGAMVAQFIVEAALMFGRYRKGVWKSIEME